MLTFRQTGVCGAHVLTFRQVDVGWDAVAADAGQVLWRHGDRVVRCTVSLTGWPPLTLLARPAPDVVLFGVTPAAAMTSRPRVTSYIRPAADRQTVQWPQRKARVGYNWYQLDTNFMLDS